MRRKGNSHLFSRIPRADIQRSVFDRSHTYKTTFSSGFLVPVLFDEVLPGDSFKLDMSFIARLATPIAPIMDTLYLDTFFFFVPMRLLWKHSEQFFGQQDYPGATTDYLVPQTSAPSGGWPVGSFEDYIGLPTGVGNIKANELAARAYALIWNEWFRDENLQNPVNLSTWEPIDSASDLDDIGVGDAGYTGTHNLLRRGKRHDYFTSALPWPQKGPGVGISLTGNADITGQATISSLAYNGTASNTDSSNAQLSFMLPSDYTVRAGQSGSFSAPFRSDSNNGRLTYSISNYGNVDTSGLTVNLSDISAITINSLREAFQMQRLYERDARGGTRYTEILRSHFGVVSPDSRLQRPEYLGGSESMIIINPVVQNSATEDTGTPQGNLSAFGLCASSKHGFTKSFVEHGVIIGLVEVRAPLSYQQGIPRAFSRRTRFDYYWPVFAHLGEQTILNQEIYAQGNEQDSGVFGYQERYAEYRYFPNTITGEFRSTYAQTLDYWHLAQKFDSLPVLNDEFIQDKPPVERVVAVQSEPQFIFDSYFKMKCARPMPVYGVPGLVDHF